VDTALATLGYGYAAYLTYFVISTYCASGHKGPRAYPYRDCPALTTERRTRSNMTECIVVLLVALLPQHCDKHGVGQQVNGTRLSTRGRATRRGGCPVYTHATHCDECRALSAVL
jgi:hypothetical protein